MRPARLVGAFVALVLTCTLSQGLPQPAQAAKPKHQLTARAYERGTTNRFFVAGKVSTYPGGKIRLLRNVDGGKYEVYKRFKTKGSGRFTKRIFQVGGKKTCFKVQVPGTTNYRKTTSPNLGCILRG